MHCRQFFLLCIYDFHFTIIILEAHGCGSVIINNNITEHVKYGFRKKESNNNEINQ